MHLKEFTKKGTDHSLESFRPLLDGTTNWPAVLEAFDETEYRGFLTFEIFTFSQPRTVDLSRIQCDGRDVGAESDLGEGMTWLMPLSVSVERRW